MAERELRTTSERARAKDWALALASEGIEARLTKDSPGYVLWVAELDVERAEVLLGIYERENRRSPGDARPTASVSGSASFHGALAVTTAMVVFFTVTGPRNPQSVWFAQGSADASRMAAGELWRSVSALTLHADWGHVASNAVMGAVLLTALGRSVGPGVAFALAVFAGVNGNITNAVLRSAPHVSIGASTAVFGIVGILSGLSVMRRRESGENVRHVALPVAGALAILAMIGTGGGRVDIWAHLFGLLAGLPIGLIAGWRWRDAPRTAGQVVAAAGAVAGLLWSWQLALAAV